MASLITLCAIGIAALLVVNLVNRWETQAKRARQKARMLKFRAEGLEELAMLLDTVVDSRRIVQFVHNEVLELLATARELDPSARYLDAAIGNAEKMAAELSDARGSRSISRVKNSNAQIARTQQAISEAIRILRRQQSRGQIDTSELETYLSELNWLYLQVEVHSLVGQGMMAMKKQDVLGAFAFYKRAQTCMIQSEQKDPRRQRWIKELNEMLGQRRIQPSPDLMPEAAALLKDSTPVDVTEPEIDVMGNQAHGGEIRANRP